MIFPVRSASVNSAFCPADSFAPKPVDFAAQWRHGAAEFLSNQTGQRPLCCTAIVEKQMGQFSTEKSSPTGPRLARNQQRGVSFFLIALSLLFSTSVRAAPKVLASCPSTLITTQSIDALPNGFQVLDAGPRSSRLIAASFYGGPPDQGGALAPDGEADGIIYWNFGAAADAENWIVCQYSDARTRIARRLPAGVMSCRISYQPHRGKRFILGVSEVISIHCIK